MQLEEEVREGQRQTAQVELQTDRLRKENKLLEEMNSSLLLQHSQQQQQQQQPSGSPLVSGCCSVIITHSSQFWLKFLAGVWTEIEVIFCGPVWSFLVHF